MNSSNQDRLSDLIAKQRDERLKFVRAKRAKFKSDMKQMTDKIRALETERDELKAALERANAQRSAGIGPMRASHKRNALGQITESVFEPVEPEPAPEPTDRPRTHRDEVRALIREAKRAKERF